MVIDPSRSRPRSTVSSRRGSTSPRRILVSEQAHVVFPYHMEMDRGMERRLGASPIGTTGKGITPAYADKVGRTRCQDGRSCAAGARSGRALLRKDPGKQPDASAHGVRAGPRQEDGRDAPARGGENRAPHHRHPGRAVVGPRAGEKRAVRRRAGHASRHRSRDVPVRDVELGVGGRRRRGRGDTRLVDRPGDRHLQGVLHPRRERPVSRPRRRGASREETCARSAASTARRRGGRAGAGGSTASPDGPSSSSTGSRRSRSPSSTCLTPSTRSRCAPDTDAGKRASTTFRRRCGRWSAADREYEILDGWRKRTDARWRRAVCRATALAYVERLERIVECRIGIVSLGPDRRAVIERP